MGKWQKKQEKNLTQARQKVSPFPAGDQMIQGTDNF